MYDLWRRQASASTGKLNGKGAPPAVLHINNQAISMNSACQGGALSFFRHFPRMKTFAGAFCFTNPGRVRLFSRDFGAMTTEASSLRGSWMPHGTTHKRSANAIEGDIVVRQLIFALHGTKGTGVQLLQACAGRFRHSCVPGEIDIHGGLCGEAHVRYPPAATRLFPQATPLAP
jgi:hypothetical protein